MKPSHEPILGVTRRGDILFVRKHEVAVIQGGLEVSDAPANTTKDRPVFTSRLRSAGQSPFKSRNPEQGPLLLSPNPLSPRRRGSPFSPPASGSMWKESRSLSEGSDTLPKHYT